MKMLSTSGPRWSVLLATTLLCTTGLVRSAQAGTCPEDTNGDNVVDVTDLINVILCWLTDGQDCPSPGINSEITGDGVVDVLDLIDVILAWGPCPGGEYMCNATPASPENDCCDNPAAVTGKNVTLSFDTTNAETDGPEDPANTCNSADDDIQAWKDVWYLYTAAEGGQLTVSNCNLAEFDSKIVAYSVPGGVVDCNTILDNIIGCNEDCAEDGVFFTSELEFFVEAGQQYLIRLGGFSSTATEEGAEFGPGQISFTLVSNNDLCSVAEPISVGDQVVLNLDEATADDVLGCPNGTTGPGVWYRVIGNGNTYTAETCATFVPPAQFLDTNLHIYCGQDPAEGPPCDGLICVGDSDVNSCGLLNETQSWCTEPDAEYYILVSSNGPAPPGGVIVLDLTEDGVPCDVPACIPQGACCVNLECVDTGPIEECDVLGGTWLEGQTCPDFDCNLIPVNNDCENALAVGEGSFAVDTTFADTDGPTLDPSCDKGFGLSFEDDIWFLYTPSQTGTVEVSTCSMAPGWDTRLAAYEGVDVDCDNLVFVTCNDDGPDCANFTSIMPVDVTAGVPILVRLGGFDGATGKNGVGTMTIGFP